MEGREDLNRRLAMGSKGSSWTPRITENQLDAIRSAIDSSARSIDRARIRAYVESGDLESLSDDEATTLQELTRQAKDAAVSADDVKRIWPRKVAVVLLANR